MLVVCIHTPPLTSYTPLGDFWLTRVLARVAVPFFLMVSGPLPGPERLEVAVEIPEKDFAGVRLRGGALPAPELVQRLSIPPGPVAPGAAD